jgi:hypothetical protein
VCRRGRPTPIRADPLIVYLTEIGNNITGGRIRGTAENNVAKEDFVSFRDGK